jgi:hypothetical protein
LKLGDYWEKTAIRDIFDGEASRTSSILIGLVRVMKINVDDCKKIAVQRVLDSVTNLDSSAEKGLIKKIVSDCFDFSLEFACNPENKSGMNLPQLMDLVKSDGLLRELKDYGFDLYIKRNEMAKQSFTELDLRKGVYAIGD